MITVMTRCWADWGTGRGGHWFSYWCPQDDGDQEKTACCVDAYPDNKCCYVEDTTGFEATYKYMWRWHPWLFCWSMAAILVGICVVLGGICVCRKKVSNGKGLFKFFLYGCCGALPCSWPFAFIGVLLAVYLEKKECSLCKEQVRMNSGNHRPECKERLQNVYDYIPDSEMYSCADCNSPLKLWPVEKIEKSPCIKCRNFEIINSGSNLHMCFVCDGVLCDRHNAYYPSRLVVDFRKMDSLVTVELGRSIDAQPLLDHKV